ncbi:hypothetical protein ACFLX7_03535 [Chloroflexota bacterium]
MKDPQNIQKELGPFTKTLISYFKGITRFPAPKLNMYALQENRIILSLFIPKGETLINVIDDGNIYAIKGGALTVLTASETEVLVEDKVVKDIESKISTRLAAVETDCNLIKHLFSSLPIIRSFDKNSTPLSLPLAVHETIHLEPELALKLHRTPKTLQNGGSRGNIFFLKESLTPRLKDTYLRYSLPMFMLPKLGHTPQKMKTIYIVPGGGIFYSTQDYPYYSEQCQFIIKLHNSPNAKPHTMKFITCFLKSSFLSWYIKNKYDNLNIFEPRIFNKIRTPLINDTRQGHKNIIMEIISLFDEITSLEFQFLILTRKTKAKDLGQLSTQHNSEVDKLAYTIDSHIYKLLGLSDSDIDVIESNLRLNSIFLPQT